MRTQIFKNNCRCFIWNLALELTVTTPLNFNPALHIWDQSKSTIKHKPNRLLLPICLCKSFTFAWERMEKWGGERMRKSSGYSWVYTAYQAMDLCVQAIQQLSFTVSSRWHLVTELEKTNSNGNQNQKPKIQVFKSMYKEPLLSPQYRRRKSWSAPRLILKRSVNRWFILSKSKHSLPWENVGLFHWAKWVASQNWEFTQSVIRVQMDKHLGLFLELSSKRWKTSYLRRPL